MTLDECVRRANLPISVRMVYKYRKRVIKRQADGKMAYVDSLPEDCWCFELNDPTLIFPITTKDSKNASHVVNMLVDASHLFWKD